MNPWTSPNPTAPQPCPFFVREGTMDGDTLQSACIEDEYGIRGLVTPGDVVVDCGAYVGGFSALALSLGAIVHAVEPIQSNCEMIRANTRTWADRFHLTRAALSSAPGPIPVRSGDNLGGIHRFMGHTIELSNPSKIIEFTPTVTLNEILDPLFIVAFLKIDIEGGEWDSLPFVSAENLAKVERIAIEIHPRHGRPVADELPAITKLLPGMTLARTSAADAWYVR